MKNTIIKWARIIAFLLTFIIIINALSVHFFTPKRGTQYYNKHRYAYEFLNEPDNSVQIVGIGNSDLYSGIDPNRLWADYGFTSTISAAPRQTPFESYNLLKQILKTQSPEIVIIETDMLYSNNPRQADIHAWNEIMSEYCDTDLFDGMIERKLPVFYYHDKWKDYKKLTPEKGLSHGFVYKTKKVSFDPGDFMIKTDEVEEFSVINRDYTKRMIELCKDKNIIPILIDMPSPSSWDYKKHNAVEAFAKELDIEFIDMNLLIDKIGINFQKDFRDEGNHLNYKGATKVTKYFGDYVKDNFMVDDRRDDPDFKYWQDNLERFLDYRKLHPKNKSKK